MILYKVTTTPTSYIYTIRNKFAYFLGIILGAVFIILFIVIRGFRVPTNNPWIVGIFIVWFSILLILGISDFLLLGIRKTIARYKSKPITESGNRWGISSKLEIGK